jgi:hypothetical protein
MVLRFCSAGVLPVAVAVHIGAVCGVAGARPGVLGGGHGLGDAGRTGEVEHRGTVVALLLALPGVVFSDDLLSDTQTDRDTHTDRHTHGCFGCSVQPYRG